MRLFIKAAYQCSLTSGAVTAATSGYNSGNRFAGLTTEDDVSDNGTAKTIVESINMHMANLSASVLTQSAASNNANTAVFNASIQQMAANEAQRNADHTRMMQQFALMQSSVNTVLAFRPQSATQQHVIPSTIPVLGHTQQWTPQGVGPGGQGGGGLLVRQFLLLPQEIRLFRTFQLERNMAAAGLEIPNSRTS